jgi:hypothetical protein
MSSFKHIFTPIAIGKVKLKNRVVLSPMATNYGTDKGGMTERQIHYYLERARTIYPSRDEGRSTVWGSTTTTKSLSTEN